MVELEWASSSWSDALCVYTCPGLVMFGRTYVDELCASERSVRTFALLRWNVRFDSSVGHIGAYSEMFLFLFFF